MVQRIVRRVKNKTKQNKIAYTENVGNRRKIARGPPSVKYVGPMNRSLAKNVNSDRWKTDRDLDLKYIIFSEAIFRAI